jgi:hypothetical protein
MDKKEDKWVITMANQLLLLKRSRKEGLDNLKFIGVYPVKLIKQDSIFKDLLDKDMIKNFIYQKKYLIQSELNPELSENIDIIDVERSNDKEIEADKTIIKNRLNNRPRKRLEFKTLAEVFN